MVAMNTIIVPLDFSDTSGRLLEAAEAEARLRSAKLVLLHVIEPSAEVAGFEADPQMMHLRIGQNLEDEGRVEEKRMQKLSATINERGVSCATCLKFGLPADEIIAARKEHEANLIIMGSHGRGALYHLFAGSVVTGVLRQTECPVLVVPLRKAAAK